MDFSQHICIVIPTYNNAGTLSLVVEKALKQQLPIVVVNDGSTDQTGTILSGYKDAVHIISYPVNQGKGYALQQAFKWAYEQGFEYAVTIDSDNQHNADNIPRFIEKLNEVGECMIMGERNMTQDGIPTKSNFGRKFSNFWFKVETWQKSNDTQTGFRLYPLKVVSRLHFFTKRFEFEIESLVRIAWENVPVVAVPVDVTYFSGEERVSHFRPFKDFTRISLLNTVLFICAYCFFLPRLLWKKAKRSNKIDFYNLFFSPHESNLKKSTSIGFGVFMGIIPVWGFQMLTATFLAALLRLNKILVLLASNISLPPLIPFIVFGSLWCGKWVLGTESVIEFSSKLTFQDVSGALFQYVIGSIVLAIVAGLLAFVTSYIILYLTRKENK